MAIIRLESLCPFPVKAAQETLSQYPNAKGEFIFEAKEMFAEYIWSQEEPRNAGAWSFVRPRFANALGINLKYAGRPELAWTATAIGEHHAKEFDALIKATFE